jgi:hypothetical protein
MPTPSPPALPPPSLPPPPSPPPPVPPPLAPGACLDRWGECPVGIPSASCSTLYETNANGLSGCAKVAADGICDPAFCRLPGGDLATNDGSEPAPALVYQYHAVCAAVRARGPARPAPPP